MMQTSTATAQDNDILTPTAAAKHIGISLPTLHKWVRMGQLPAQRVGRIARFSRRALSAWASGEWKPAKPL